jgi:hypothetical protein
MFNPFKSCKVINVTPPAAINDNTAYTTATVDSLGWKAVTFLIILGAMDIAVAALKLTESDDSGMSGAVDITGADFSVSPATLPSATDDNHLFAIHVKCTGKRKRYFDLTFTAGDGSAGTYATVLAVLSEGEIVPVSATQRGFTQELTV